MYKLDVYLCFIILCALPFSTHVGPHFSLYALLCGQHVACAAGFPPPASLLTVVVVNFLRSTSLPQHWAPRGWGLNHPSCAGSCPGPRKCPGGVGWVLGLVHAPGWSAGLAPGPSRFPWPTHLLPMEDAQV